MNAPLPCASSPTVATVESEPNPAPCLQHLTLTLLNPGADREMAVSPAMSEQYSGEFTAMTRRRVSSAVFSASTLSESKYRSLSTSASLSPSFGWLRQNVIALIGYSILLVLSPPHV